jgi:hypothetical protein
MAGLVWRPRGVGAALCFAVLLLGAVFTHVRAGDSAPELAPALIVFTVDVVYLVVAGPALR